jgi:hypothetical protein
MIGAGNWLARASNGSITCLASSARNVAVTQVSGRPDNGAFQVQVMDTATQGLVDADVDGA